MSKGRKIDKSVLTFGIPQRIEDDAYRERPKREHGQVVCENCLGHRCRNETVVGAHPRALLAGGTALKPSDDLICFFGKACHDEQETAGALWLVRFTFTRMLGLEWPADDEPDEMESMWLLLHVFRPMRRRIYLGWRERQQ